MPAGSLRLRRGRLYRPGICKPPPPPLPLPPIPTTELWDVFVTDIPRVTQHQFYLQLASSSDSGHIYVATVVDGTTIIRIYVTYSTDHATCLVQADVLAGDYQGQTYSQAGPYVTVNPADHSWSTILTPWGDLGLQVVRPPQ